MDGILLSIDRAEERALIRVVYQRCFRFLSFSPQMLLLDLVVSFSLLRLGKP